MKKIIGGKVYDTATAEHVAAEKANLNSFYRTREGIYRTKKGAWFLHGESSAGGKYSAWCGNSCYYGEEILALEPAQVIIWAEGARIDDDEKSRIAELLNLPEA